MATTKPASSFIYRSCRHNLFSRPRRLFSATSALRADDRTSTLERDLFRSSNYQQPKLRHRPDYPRSRSGMETASNINKQLGIDFDDEKSTLSNLQALDGTQMEEAEKPHRLHIYAHKHNTHITFVQPSKPASQTPHLAPASTAKQTAQQQNKSIDVLLSLSTGNIGFKKAGRGSYDAAFQLAAFALRQIQEKGMAREVKNLEVVLRGFGAGREAVTKALLGTEGRLLRSKISSVADATRLKQGGGRSKKPRRLG